MQGAELTDYCTLLKNESIRKEELLSTDLYKGPNDSKLLSVLMREYAVDEPEPHKILWSQLADGMDASTRVENGVLLDTDKKVISIMLEARRALLPSLEAECGVNLP